MPEPDPLATLRDLARELRRLGKRYCVVGGLGVSMRGEVRFTRDVDVAMAVDDDAETEAVSRELLARGYAVIALVEHDDAGRLATVRLRAPGGITVDLLTASSGIEAEIVARASLVDVEGVGPVPVAQPEELLAMKVLSMDERRLQDRVDALKLLEICDGIDLARVRANLRLIEERGFGRQQNLADKLEQLLAQRAPP